MSSSAPIITFKNVWKKYSKSRIFHRSFREDITKIFSLGGPSQSLDNNEFWALKEINLQVLSGESVGLYGPNGSGKSTILKMIANVTYPTQGKVVMGGSVAPLIAIGAGFHSDLSGKENIYMNGAILGMRIKEINEKIDNIIDFSGVRNFIDMPVKNYSSGMYLRLAFSIAIHSQADIYLFDEIISVGDSDFRKKCIDKIKKLKRAGKTIILVTHSLSLAKSLSDKILFLEKGKIILEEKHPDQLKTSSH